VPETRRTSESSAERQLTWSRRYLRREKRSRLTRRIVVTFFFAVLLALGLYAVTVNGGLSLPVFAPSSSSSAGPPSSGSHPDSISPSDTSGSAAPGLTASASTSLQTCVVTFDARGGTMDETAFSVAYGTCVSEPTPPTRTGYTFGGWYTDAARTRAWDFEKNAVLENLTLYARWQLAEPSAGLPQTGVSADASFWACVMAVCLALAALLAYLCRRLERR